MADETGQCAQVFAYITLKGENADRGLGYHLPECMGGVSGAVMIVQFWIQRRQPDQVVSPWTTLADVRNRDVTARTSVIPSRNGV